MKLCHSTPRIFSASFSTPIQIDRLVPAQIRHRHVDHLIAIHRDAYAGHEQQCQRRRHCPARERRALLGAHAGYRHGAQHHQPRQCHERDRRHLGADREAHGQPECQRAPYGWLIGPTEQGDEGQHAHRSDWDIQRHYCRMTKDDRGCQQQRYRGQRAALLDPAVHQ